MHRFAEKDLQVEDKHYKFVTIRNRLVRLGETKASQFTPESASACSKKQPSQRKETFLIVPKSCYIGLNWFSYYKTEAS